jgi:hypothetical protein
METLPQTKLANKAQETKKKNKAEAKERGIVLRRLTLRLYPNKNQMECLGAVERWNKDNYNRYWEDLRREYKQYKKNWSQFFDAENRYSCLEDCSVNEET